MVINLNSDVKAVKEFGDNRKLEKCMRCNNDTTKTCISDRGDSRAGLKNDIPVIDINNEEIKPSIDKKQKEVITFGKSKTNAKLEQSNRNRKIEGKALEIAIQVSPNDMKNDKKIASKIDKMQPQWKKSIDSKMDRKVADKIIKTDETREKTCESISNSTFVKNNDRSRNSGLYGNTNGKDSRSDKTSIEKNNNNRYCGRNFNTNMYSKRPDRGNILDNEKQKGFLARPTIRPNYNRSVNNTKKEFATKLNAGKEGNVPVTTGKQSL